MYIDTHAHIYKEYYDDIDGVIKGANDNGVTRVVNCATDFKNFDEIISLSKRFENLYFSLGIHPEEGEYVKEEDYSKLEVYIKENLDNPKFIGIGEIGLDYFHNIENIKDQKNLFIYQLDLAAKYNLPVIIHSREATKDTIDILGQYKLKGIVHCFSGSVETAREYIKLGYKLGIGGLVTFKNCNLKEKIEDIGIENIVLETDSPYVTPEPFRGTKNEPSNIPVIAKKVAELSKLDLDEIEKKTTENCNEIFDFNR